MARRFSKLLAADAVAPTAVSPSFFMALQMQERLSTSFARLRAMWRRLGRQALTFPMQCRPSTECDIHCACMATEPLTCSVRARTEPWMFIRKPTHHHTFKMGPKQAEPTKEHPSRHQSCRLFHREWCQQGLLRSWRTRKPNAAASGRKGSSSHAQHVAVPQLLPVLCEGAAGEPVVVGQRKPMCTWPMCSLQGFAALA